MRVYLSEIKPNGLQDIVFTNDEGKIYEILKDKPLDWSVGKPKSVMTQGHMEPSDIYVHGRSYKRISLSMLILLIGKW